MLKIRDVNKKEVLMENRNYEETGEINGTHQEERKRGEFNTHKLCWKQEKKGNQLITYLTTFYAWMAGVGERKPLKHQKLLLTTKVRMLWRHMVVHVLKGHERRRSVIRSSNVRHFFVSQEYRIELFIRSLAQGYSFVIVQNLWSYLLGELSH